MAGLIEVTFTFPQGGKHEEPLVMSFPRACLDDVDPDSQSMFAAKLSFLRLGKENKGKGKGKGKASDSVSSSSASKKRKRDAGDDTAETVKLTIETKADSGTYYIPEACQFVIEAIRAFPEPVLCPHDLSVLDCLSALNFFGIEIDTDDIKIAKDDPQRISKIVGKKKVKSIDEAVEKSRSNIENKLCKNDAMDAYYFIVSQKRYRWSAPLQPGNDSEPLLDEFPRKASESCTPYYLTTETESYAPLRSTYSVFAGDSAPAQLARSRLQSAVEAIGVKAEWAKRYLTYNFDNEFGQKNPKRAHFQVLQIHLHAAPKAALESYEDE